MWCEGKERECKYEAKYLVHRGQKIIFLCARCLRKEISNLEEEHGLKVHRMVI